MKTVNQIRSSFLEYFEKLNHQIVASSPLVPHNDPTLMFTNAGMVQFKDVFTGKEKLDFKRAVSSQKCVRAGGKHNDLDNVGFTARHHTFFEMLGNFSFGDYFKEDAIKYSWKFLTEELGISQDKLLVTIYHTDMEAYDLWKKIANLPDEKIIKIATKDNFWSMGDIGPCGPCSEIFYDHGSHIAGGPPGSKDENGDRFIEIWNLVFMQYEMKPDGSRVDLPSPSIDTGMGLERIAAVLQNVHDNYDIDLFKSLIAASREITKDKTGNIVAHRIIADHLRSASFLIADGVMPSNEGRGYVLRRIMRRAMRQVKQIGYKDILLHKLVPHLVQIMQEAYPELKRAQNLIEEILKYEEENFSQTLEKGLKLLEKETINLVAGDILAGEIIFKLYDTYGFPYDLTADILKTKKIILDEAGFNAAMKKQKELAGANWKGSGEKSTSDIWYEIKDKFGACEFYGYNAIKTDAQINAIIKDGKIIDSAKKGDRVEIVLNQTVFYGESGGQEGDKGVIIADKNVKLKVIDTKKYLNDIIVHICDIESGNIRTQDKVTPLIDVSRREKLKAAHTATHILHAILREELGTHIVQKGSLVGEDRLRFDISHPKAIAKEELIKIESRVNEIIRKNINVTTDIMSHKNAVAAGALALFGEKYQDEVRVLSIKDNNINHSVELCGGTHVSATGDIGLFKIISESAVAAGIRRIEALTGDAGLKYIQDNQILLNDIASLLKTSPSETVSRLEQVLSDRKKSETEMKNLKQKLATKAPGGKGNIFEEYNDIKLFLNKFSDINAKELRDIVNDTLSQNPTAIIAYAAIEDKKAAFIIALGKDVSQNYDALKLLSEVKSILGTDKGGGKRDFAQTGSNDISSVDRALNKIKAIISSKR